MAGWYNEAVERLNAELTAYYDASEDYDYDYERSYGPVDLYFAEEEINRKPDMTLEELFELYPNLR